MTELSTLPRAEGPARWAEARDYLGGLSILDRLFNRMDGAYGLKWKANFPSPETIRNWREECATAFEEEGITPAQVIAGIRACRRLHPEWPPNVQQFVNACNPPVDPVAAYHEALAGLEARAKGERGAWSHPAIYWAASSLRGDLASQSAQYIKDRWAAALKAQLARGTWEDIPPPRVLLPAPGKSPTAPEAAAIEFANIAAMNLLRKRGSKDWAIDIMRRHSEHDPKLKLFQIRAARAALGLDLSDTTEGE